MNTTIEEIEELVKKEGKPAEWRMLNKVYTGKVQALDEKRIWFCGKSGSEVISGLVVTGQIFLLPEGEAVNGK